MKSHTECLACLSKNAVDIAKMIGGDEAEQQEVVRRGMMALAGCNMALPPPFHLHEIWDAAMEITGGRCPDPYRPQKEASIKLAMELAAHLDGIPQYNPASFESRLRLATAGNVLDFGIYSDLRLDSAMKIISDSFSRKIDLAALARLEERVSSAKSIFYLLDNCGEAIFDRIFMEPFLDKVTFGVRGAFTLNDMTRAELGESGFDGCRVVDNGSNIPGTVLECCSEEFKAAIDDAELVIAKGQGNFETLSDTSKPAAMLFMAKCPVVCREIGAEQNTVQIKLMNF
ncbi:MAG: DUF89 family protein [Victivallales bacterium]|nr:DUF89 family protein [Victivallales bacterium]